jgi:3',5'-cyclic AMP phosphodiesterase CpdA
MNDHHISRRGALSCLAWGGTGILWTMAGGVPAARALGAGTGKIGESGAFSFVQISDTHLGFAREANPDTLATARLAVERINAEAADAALVLHTGDITHLSRPAEFDTAAELLRGLKPGELHLVPGEHDVLDSARAAFLDRYGAASKGKGYYSFDHQGVHFIALVNVMEFKPGGQGRLGPAQTEWLEDDLAGRSASQPIVIFTHIPLWSLYPAWGWSTEDWPQALSYLKRFGSVTVLNGHVHQVVQKVEGTVTHYAAASTAYPQPAPGQAEGPGPMTVPADRLRAVLGVRRIESRPLTINDGSLA